MHIWTYVHTCKSMHAHPLKEHSPFCETVCLPAFFLGGKWARENNAPLACYNIDLMTSHWCTLCTSRIAESCWMLQSAVVCLMTSTVPWELSLGFLYWVMKSPLIAGFPALSTGARLWWFRFVWGFPLSFIASKYVSIAESVACVLAIADLFLHYEVVNKRWH